MRDLRDEQLDALVTAPIDKESIQSDDFRYTGHTEFLAAELGGEPLMMMCSDLLRMGLVTIHIPVTEISHDLTRQKIVTRLEQLRSSLKAHQTAADVSRHYEEIEALAFGKESPALGVQKTIPVSYPLRRDFTVRFEVPENLTKGEAKRLASFFEGLYFEEE